MKNISSSRAKTRTDYGLTGREQEVLSLAVKGLSRPEIARQHGVETSTVCAQMKSIYRKLGVRNRAEAVAKALKHGGAGEFVAPGTVRGSRPAGLGRVWRYAGLKGSGTPADEAMNCPHCGGGLHLPPVTAGGKAFHLAAQPDGQNFHI